MIFRIEGEAKLEKGLGLSVNTDEKNLEEDKTDFLYNKESFDKLDKIKNKEINTETNKYIQGQIIKMIEKISIEEKVDFLNLYRQLYSNKKLWLKYQGKQDEFLQDFEYIIEVNIGI